MPTAAEVAGDGNSQIQAVLEAGLETLSNDETVTFTLYNRAVVSDDGSVFWVATETKKTVRGSLHISVDRFQEEDQTIGATTAIFTSQELVTEFNAIAPGTMWIGTWTVAAGITLQVAFARRGRFYEEAKLWHYSGYTIFPAMQSQIIADESDLPDGPIVSNSLPIWLSLTTFMGTTVPVYPSYLVPDNIVPPYIAAHIDPRATTALQSMPLYPTDGTSGSGLKNLFSMQLMRDEVTLTFYGFNAQTAAQYLAMLIDYSMVGYGETPTFGFANSPAFEDDKRHQTEIAALAQKKMLKISANYYNVTADAIARRLILTAALKSVTINPHPGT